MQPAPFSLIANLLEDSLNGWSIGSFGAIGEFMRDADEPATIHRTAEQIDVVTTRGAMRVRATALTGVAWDTLSGDGETWGHVLAFCAPRPATGTRVVRFLGHDVDAIRAEGRSAIGEAFVGQIPVAGGTRGDRIAASSGAWRL